MTAPTTRETADHAELKRIAEQCRLKADKLGCDEWRAPALLKQASRGLETLLSEIAALRGERDGLIEAAAARNSLLEITERQRDELRKATETAAGLFKLCTEPTMFENASTLNVYAQMTEWLVRNRPLIANQGADQ